MYFGYLFFIGLVGVVSNSQVTIEPKLDALPEYIDVGPGPVIMEPPPLSDEPQDCGNVSVDNCLKNLQTFLRLKSLPYASKGSELDSLCDQALAGYNCSALMFQTPSCLNPRDKELLPLFMEMAEYTFFMLCKQEKGNFGYLRNAFLQNSECVLQHKSEMECCAQETKLPDLPVMRILEESSKSLAERQISACCPVSSYLKCTRKVIVKGCGEDAGNFTTEYIRRAAGQQMEAVCQEMPQFPDPDPKLCPNPSPTCSSCRTADLHQQLLIMFISFVSLRLVL